MATGMCGTRTSHALTIVGFVLGVIGLGLVTITLIRKGD